MPLTAADKLRARYETDEKYREKKRAWNREYNRTHPEVIRAAVARYRVAHPERVKKNQRTQSLKMYGLNHAEYDAMLAAQGGVCAICRGPQKNRRRMAIDHDHATGRVRGLLCDRCNTGIANFDDDTDRMRVAIAYLTPR